VLQAGLYPAYLGTAAFSEHIARQYEHYARIIDDARIKAE